MKNTIHVYTRAQAISDGALIDVTPMASELFAFPVAISCALHADISDIPEEARGFQSYDGRLWDVLWMAYCAIRAAKRMGVEGEELVYRLLMSVSGERRNIYRVKLVVGPGDGGEPVVTLMKPRED